MSTIIRLPVHAPAHVIGEDQVSPAQLQSLLEAAVIDVELDGEGDPLCDGRAGIPNLDQNFEKIGRLA